MVDIKASNQFKNLLYDLKSRQSLCLFLGAGVNYSFAPTWDDLLDELVKSLQKRDKGKLLPDNMTWFIKSTDISVYEKASFVKHLLGDYYLPVLRNILYKKGILGALQRLAEDHSTSDTLLAGVAELCQNPLVKGVVTYNYDNLLELFLYLMHEQNPNTRLGYSVYGEPQQTPANVQPNSFPVYHVHGFLPYERRLPEPDKTRIVLAEQEYYDSALDPFSWQTTTQVYLLRNHTCLWIGTSLKDMNMRRLSHYARRHNTEYRSYAVMCEQNLPRHKDSLLENEVNTLKRHRVCAALLKTVGIDLLYSGKEHSSNTQAVKALSTYWPD